MANYKQAASVRFHEYTITDYHHINVFQLSDHKDWDTLHDTMDAEYCGYCPGGGYVEFWRVPCKFIPFDKYGLPVGEEEDQYWPT